MVLSRQLHRIPKLAMFPQQERPCLCQQPTVYLNSGFFLPLVSLHIYFKIRLVLSNTDLVWVPAHSYFLCLYLTWYLLANTEQTHTLAHRTYYWDVNIEQEKEPKWCGWEHLAVVVMIFRLVWSFRWCLKLWCWHTQWRGGGVLKSYRGLLRKSGSRQLLISKLLEGFSVFMRQETSVESDFISQVWPPHTSSGAHPGCPRKNVLDTPLWCSIITSEPMFGN